MDEATQINRILETILCKSGNWANDLSEAWALHRIRPQGTILFNLSWLDLPPHEAALEICKAFLHWNQHTLAWLNNVPDNWHIAIERREGTWRCIISRYAWDDDRMAWQPLSEGEGVTIFEAIKAAHPFDHIIQALEKINDPG